MTKGVAEKVGGKGGQERVNGQLKADLLKADTEVSSGAGTIYERLNAVLTHCRPIPGPNRHHRRLLMIVTHMNCYFYVAV